MTDQFPQTRLRRLRYHAGIRRLISETTLTTNDLVMPLFVQHGEKNQTAIKSMPGQFRYTVDRLPNIVNEIHQLTIPAVLLFGIPATKDQTGEVSYKDESLIHAAIKSIKASAPELVVITDNCFCDYTEHGHCGVINEKTGKSDIDNDATLALLAKQAVSYAQAGADVIAPSGSQDGMVHTIRQALDQAGFTHIPILSYAVKYASSLYGPFREAADCAPQFGDRKTYQMDPANSSGALRETLLDVEEGADMLMVKPAAHFMDIIYRVKQAHPGLPLAAYHTSGEYSMLKAAAEKGWLDEQTAALEIATSIKRAGADFILTYYAKDIARWLNK